MVVAMGVWGWVRWLWKGGRCQRAGVIWRLVVMQGFKMSARCVRRLVRQPFLLQELQCKIEMEAG